MELYRCDLVLHDYLFFATTERGKVAETGPFIHNYALTYALGWATSPWRNEEQLPHYNEELSQVGQRYATPARLVGGSYLVSQYNTMSESYSLSKGRSIGYPDWGFIKGFRPGSIFRFYVISSQPVEFPLFIRLGKFMAKTRIIVTRANQVQRSTALNSEAKREGSPVLLNWTDLAPAGRPLVYDIVASALPTRLVDNPVFQGVIGPYLSATFTRGEQDKITIDLPLQMGYLGANLCLSW
ncbi:MAG: type I-D CRISPR-associated protein Cas5/Csc1 [Chloroflexota bacterium]|nr:type I-D CRISPR-associated protein Cas5/Csc1 [Chloroflexota bacterium]